MSSSRDTSRDTRRLASLYNGVAYEQLRALCWDVLASCELRYDNKLEIWAQKCQRPIAQTSLFGSFVSENVVRTFVSINKCVVVIVHNIGWLAYCIESLDIEIKELTLTKPKRVHEVEFWYAPGAKHWPTDWNHTILLLTPRSGGEPIVADASYAQYSFDTGIDTVEGYVDRKVDEESDFFAETIGERFEKNEDDIELPVCDRKKAEAIIRTTNNVMVRELRAAGGIEVLLDLSSDSFETTKDEIFGAIRGEMEALRLLLEHIAFGGDSLDVEGLENLVQDCDGAGHQSSMRSLERERSVWPPGFDELFTA